MQTPLKKAFLALLQPYSSDAASLWQAVEEQYSAPGRHYHNLQHLEEVYSALENVRNSVTNWEALVLATVYHDYVYEPGRSDNEERSAAHAAEIVRKLRLPGPVRRLVQQHIEATKRHGWSSEADTNYFTDADLSILGAPPDAYRAYTHAIRKEYAIYPDPVYRRGRLQVVEHFLHQDRLFKTEAFRQRLEEAAHSNLATERERLMKGIL